MSGRLKARLAKVEAVQDSIHRQQQRPKFLRLGSVWDGVSDDDVIGLNGRKLRPGQTIDELALELHLERGDMVLLDPMLRNEVDHAT